MRKVNTGCSFIHPVTRQMIHPGQSYDDFAESVGDAPASPQQQSDPNAKLSLDDFLELSAEQQKQELVRLNLALSADDESVSNKEKRVVLYESYLKQGATDNDTGGND